MNRASISPDLLALIADLVSRGMTQAEIGAVIGRTGCAVGHIISRNRHVFETCASRNKREVPSRSAAHPFPSKPWRVSDGVVVSLADTVSIKVLDVPERREAAE